MAQVIFTEWFLFIFLFLPESSFGLNEVEIFLLE